MSRLYPVITVLLLLLSLPPLKAQDGQLDRALDQYERICNRCIDLRLRAAAGEAVSPQAVTDLLVELNTLRRTLQDAGGRMTPSQQARFASIRLRYTEVFEPKQSSRLELTSPPAIAASAVDCPAAFLQRPPAKRPVAIERPSPDIRTGAILYGSLPDGCAGMMVKTGHRAFGGYLKGSIRPDGTRPDYACTSDGITADGGYIWTSGREALTRFSFSGGMLYAPLSWLTCYAGAGYGRRTVLWEDGNGKWASVSDLSESGVCTDAGIILGRKHLLLMAGVSAIRFKSPALEIGLGVNF